jgi:hypothetical protein
MLDDIDFVVELKPLAGPPSPLSSSFCSHERGSSSDSYPFEIPDRSGGGGVPYDDVRYSALSQVTTDDDYQTTTSSPCPRRGGHHRRQMSSLARYSIDSAIRRDGIVPRFEMYDSRTSFQGSSESEDVPVQRRHRVGMSDDYGYSDDSHHHYVPRSLLSLDGHDQTNERSRHEGRGGGPPPPQQLGSSQSWLHSSELSIVSASSSMQSSPCPRRRQTRTMMLTGNLLRANRPMSPGFRFPAPARRPQEVVAYQQGEQASSSIGFSCANKRLHHAVSSSPRFVRPLTLDNIGGTETKPRGAKIEVCPPKRLEELGLRPGDIIPPDTPPASSVSGSSSRDSQHSDIQSPRRISGQSSSSARGSWSTVGSADSSASVTAATVGVVVPEHARPASAPVPEQFVKPKSKSKPRHRSHLSRARSIVQETILEESPSADRTCASPVLGKEEVEATTGLVPSVAAADYDQHVAFVNFEREAASELMKSWAVFPDTEKSRFYTEGEWISLSLLQYVESGKKLITMLSVDWQPPKTTYATLEFLFDSQKRFRSLRGPILPATPPQPSKGFDTAVGMTTPELSSSESGSSASSHAANSSVISSGAASKVTPSRTRRGAAASTTSTTRHSPSPGRRAFKVASPSPLRVRTRRPLTLVRPPNSLPLPSSPAKSWKQTVGSLGLGVLPSRRRKEALAAARRKLEGVPGPRPSQWAVLEEAEGQVEEEQVWEAGGEVTCVNFREGLP